eukprot:217760-Chlamydomonas_euryale.AAC.12
MRCKRLESISTHQKDADARISQFTRHPLAHAIPSAALSSRRVALPSWLSLNLPAPGITPHRVPGLPEGDDGDSLRNASTKPSTSASLPSVSLHAGQRQLRQAGTGTLGRQHDVQRAEIRGVAGGCRSGVTQMAWLPFPHTGPPVPATFAGGSPHNAHAPRNAEPHRCVVLVGVVGAQALHVPAVGSSSGAAW